MRGKARNSESETIQRGRLDGLLLEVDERKGEVRVVLVEHLSESAVPSSESREETEVSTSRLAFSVSSVRAEGEEEEGQVESGEEEDERDGCSESADQHQEGEDEPSEKVEGDGGVHLPGSLRIRSVRADDVETGNLNDSPGEPETTIAAQGSSAKGVTGGKFPHASSELDHTAIEEGKTNDDVRHSDTFGLNVNEREDKGGQRESGETQRSWVSNRSELGCGGSVRVLVLLIATLLNISAVVDSRHCVVWMSGWL